MEYLRTFAQDSFEEMLGLLTPLELVAVVKDMLQSFGIDGKQFLFLG